MVTNLSIIAPLFSGCKFGAHTFSIHTIDASISPINPHRYANIPWSTYHVLKLMSSIIDVSNPTLSWILSSVTSTLLAIVLSHCWCQIRYEICSWSCRVYAYGNSIPLYSIGPTTTISGMLRLSSLGGRIALLFRVSRQLRLLLRLGTGFRIITP